MAGSGGGDGAAKRRPDGRAGGGSRLRPDDRDALRAELRSVSTDLDFPVAFGGEVDSGSVRLTECFGTQTTRIHNLEVHEGKGLGGQVLAVGRPVGVADYGAARHITHDYDGPVKAERLSAVLAVPVRVRGTCRAVLYGAIRQRVAVGDRARDALFTAGRRLANELAVRDEVDRRMAMAETIAATRRPEVADVANLEELRSVHSELCAIAGTVEDSALQSRMYDVAQRLADLRAGETEPPPQVRLSRREIDVLAQVALGCTNAEVAERLSLAPETVKAYLRAAMRRLGAHTRHEAVVRARSAWLLP
ncbi:DNA-binding response regulator [Saccharopolyspora rhizosphaerae]|uniref:DNA-binding response regulator n=1 Tax=Saccharopolyspora rhizosphaerae TaxID=2492662 RepID=A0A3R8QZC1_9PSEU|nr:LuxR C-terminal-related transcriptional regulator [Saccharopolyspora rhizosphaerae]RRO14441.1 DNA-binding response regulator [Saccharopolyspora rhizosphaerae]